MSNTDFTFDFEDVDNEIIFDKAPEVVEEAPTLDVGSAKEDEPATDEEAEVDEGPTEEQKAEYLTIYDSIMFEDKFEKQYKLGAKYAAVFTTRSADADMKISRQLDSMNFSTMHAFQTMSAVLTMSHSLVSLNGVDLSKKTVPDRYNFIRDKSSHLIEILAGRMVQFDHLVREALEYGEVNF